MTRVSPSARAPVTAEGDEGTAKVTRHLKGIHGTWWQRALRYSRKRRLTLLLVLEAFAIFAISPLIELGALPHPLLGVTFSLILIVGMLGIDDRVWVGRLVIALGLVMLPIQLWRYVLPSEIILVVHPIGLMLFMMMLSGVLAISLFRSERIKLDQVLGGVVLYLNIGLTFAITYSVLEQLTQGTFLLPQPLPERPLHPTFFVYFSFVTLTTVGYGDIVPLGAAARSLSTLEAALGQLYPAIILARLVSIEVSQNDRSKPRSEHRKQMAKNQGRAAGDL